MVVTLISFAVCAGLPLAGAIFFGRRRDGTLVTFLVGAAGFLISQPALRLPLLAWLRKNSEWYMLLPYDNPVGYFLFAGLTAGIFEECSRWIGLGLFRRGRTGWMEGMAYGLGHGGCEAAWSFVIQVIPLAAKGQAGLGVALGAWERFFAMLVQVGFTFLVLEGVRTGKLRYLLWAILAHCLVDFSIILGNPWLLEGLIGAEGLAALGLVWRLRKRAYS